MGKEKKTGKLTPPMIGAVDASHIPMTQEIAVADGKKLVAAMTGKMNVPESEPMCIIQWGKEAFREGEPAHLTGEYMTSNPHLRGQKGFYAVVRYEDGCPNYVNMNLPRYPRGEKPPWLFSSATTEVVRDEKGAAIEVAGVPHRPADRKHWLEFIPAKMCRRALKVKE